MHKDNSFCVPHTGATPSRARRSNIVYDLLKVEILQVLGSPFMAEQRELWQLGRLKGQ